MEKLIKLKISPEMPPIEVFDDIVISLHPPYSESSVAILVHPQIGEFIENADQPGMQVRDITVLQGTADSKIYRFDLNAEKTHRITYNCKIKEFTLMRIGKESFDGQEFPFFEFAVKDIKPDMRFLKEGAVSYWLHGKQEDWPTNEEGYKFPNVNEEGIEIESTKEKDKTLSIVIKGPLKRMFKFRNSIPRCDSRGLLVAITWKDPEVKLFLNAQNVQTLNVRDGVKLDI